MNFFMEIAKLRAARLLWARLMQQFAPQNPASLALRTHCQTSGVSLTEQDPHNNIIRTTIEALAAVLGGTQSLHTNSFDEALALPTPASAQDRPQHPADPRRGDRHPACHRSARRQLLRREPDPFDRRGGDGADRRGRGAGRHDPGGREPACRNCASRNPRRGGRRAIDRGEEIDRRGQQIPLGRGGRGRAARCRQRRGARPRRSSGSSGSAGCATQGRVEAALAALTDAAQSGDGNLLALAIEATRARATVGEISDALEKVFTRHRAADPRR